MVTTAEIEDTIIRMHKDNRTTRDISKSIHKNYTYIGSILKKHFPEEYPNTENSEENKETEALKLFSEKKSPTEVAIKLGLSYEDTEKAYCNFWRLERLYELYQIYCHHKPKLREILWFIRQLRMRRDISIKNFKDVLEVLDKNKAFRDELDYFGKNVMPKFLNGALPGS